MVPPATPGAVAAISASPWGGKVPSRHPASQRGPWDMAVPCSRKGLPERGASGPMRPFNDSPIEESAPSEPCSEGSRAREGASRRGIAEEAGSALEAV